MSVDRRGLLADLLANLPDSPRDDAAVSVPGLVRGWLGPAVASTEIAQRADLDALCRQIDVRKRVSVAYLPGWKACDPELPASHAVVVGLVGVMLATAEPASTAHDGWNLKLLNSALKALDLVPAEAEGEGEAMVAALRAWAVEQLDLATVDS